MMSTTFSIAPAEGRFAIATLKGYEQALQVARKALQAAACSQPVVSPETSLPPFSVTPSPRQGVPGSPAKSKCGCRFRHTAVYTTYRLPTDHNCWVNHLIHRPDTAVKAVKKAGPLVVARQRRELHHVALPRR